MRADVSVVNFNRPPRTPTPQLPDVQIDIPVPPQAPSPPEQSILIILLPTIGIGLITTFYFVRAFDTGLGLASALPLLLLMVFTVGSALWAQSRRRRDYRLRRQEAHIHYVRLLWRKQARLQAAHDAYQAILETDFPAPDGIANIIMTHNAKLWQRRPDDADFLMLRLGTGRIASPVAVDLPDPDMVPSEFDLTFLQKFRFPRVCSRRHIAQNPLGAGRMRYTFRAVDLVSRRHTAPCDDALPTGASHLPARTASRV